MKRDFGHVGAILATRADFALDALCKKSRPTPQISSPRSVWREDLANDQPIASSGVETVHSAVLQDALAKETVDVDNDNVGNCWLRLAWPLCPCLPPPPNCCLRRLPTCAITT